MPLISISLYIIEIKQVKVCLQAIQNQITNKRKVVLFLSRRKRRSLSRRRTTTLSRRRRTTLSRRIRRTTLSRRRKI